MGPLDTSSWSNWQQKEPIGQPDLADQLFLKGSKAANETEHKNAVVAHKHLNPGPGAAHA